MLNEQEIVRREKLEFLKENGIDPFGQKYVRTDTTKTAKAKAENFTKEELEAKKIRVKIAGRLMQKRRQGKIGFINIQDKEGSIQVYVAKEIIGEEVYEIFKKSDIGDIIGIDGILMRTNTNEITIKVEEYTHLVKALKPLPEKFHGLTDVEEKRRRRYLDLIMSGEARETAIKRTQIIRAIQSFFDNRGFIEVETPILQPILGGAAAKPFITHHNALGQNFNLRIATELPLKRLIVGGLEAVYEIGRLFRNEGIDAKHNPEFTSVEAYLAYSDMEGMMDLIEAFFKEIAEKICGTLKVEFDGVIYDLTKFKRSHMVELIKEETGIDFFKEMSFEDAKAIAKAKGIAVPTHFTGVGHIINAFFEEFVEDKLIQPTLVYGHPVEISPLAKKNKDDARFTDRFELFIGKMEYANAFSELNDPIDQLARFEEQIKEKNLGNDEASEVDTDFVEALSYGLPPTGGIGIGVDRLVMFLTNKTNIRDVILFPTMKSENAKPVKEQKVEVKLKDRKIEIEPLFKDEVNFEDFSKSDFRAVKIINCEEVEKSNKLLKFTLDDGSGATRTILSGIREYYSKEELIGKTAIAITNLPKRKIMGVYSEGMLISAVWQENGREGLHLLLVDDDIPAGAKLY